MSKNILNNALTGDNRRHVTDIQRRLTDRDLSNALKQRLDFEQLVSRLSATFINIATDKVVEKINDALAEASKFLGSDFSTFIVRDPESGEFRHSHQWVAPHVETEIDFIHFDIQRDTPWIAQKLIKGDPVVINCESDLPEQATQERAIIRDLGIKSALWVPIYMVDEIAGAIVINNLDREMRWPEDLIPQLKLIGEVFVNALARTRDAEILNRQFRFEGLLASLSAGLINTPADLIDSKIVEFLRYVGEYADCDETFVFQFHDDPERPGVSHGWFRSGEPRELAFDSDQFLELFPWAASRLKRNEFIVFASLDELPAEAVAERVYLESEGILSSLVIPLMNEDVPVGVFFVDSFRKQAWPQGKIRQMNLAAQIFLSAMLRSESDRNLQLVLAEVNQLKQQLEVENIVLQQELENLSRHDEIVGSTPALMTVIGQAEQVAPLDSIVLIQGETGSGKELIANLIHHESSRGHRTMVRVNCASLPATLIEAELFGREKGAYTGALSRQVGRFELADGSTLFLDEIGELPLELQAKLLRVLQDGEFERLGSTRTLKVDVRVIAATNRDLATLIAEGNFRKDLYYRLNVFPIVVPPLRERRADIPALVWSFVRECGGAMGKSIDRISRSTMQRLQAYDWPGNVRELHNVIERSMIVSRGGTLTVSLGEVESDQPENQTLAEVDRRHILSVLEQAGWRIRGAGGAAQVLGLNPSTLESRMKKLGIKRTTR